MSYPTTFIDDWYFLKLQCFSKNLGELIIKWSWKILFYLVINNSCQSCQMVKCQLTKVDESTHWFFRPNSLTVLFIPDIISIFCSCIRKTRVMFKDYENHKTSYAITFRQRR